MTNEDSCPIWGTPAEISHCFQRDVDTVNSPRAGGTYIVSREARDDFLRHCNHFDAQSRARLTSWLVEQRSLGVARPEISSDTIKKAEQRHPLAVQERANRLLKYIAEKSDKLGGVLRFSRFETPDDVEMEMRAWSETLSRDEIIYLLRYLEKNDWIGTVFDKGFVSIIVSVPGYTHLAELETNAVDSSQAFVAMWFDESMVAAYSEGAEPSIREVGYEPMRIDRKEHINRIDDEIIAEIRRSRFLVADFTHGEAGPRGGVYYEAGFAHGLNIPVIFTCRKDKIAEVHFDTRQFNHIVWDSPEDLREKLRNRIGAVIGEGSLKELE